ncbi:hypothetical protein M422DRAFT_259345 [Sphaerobolus stellatus SS14]|uniref:Uncharacterized protein n=1 Tax=Sphaerobolus stellatus (strain SS14) TaxID=990650 RepID=A0A0C9V8V8_SPHS4|nr:hypothetical protein M422DRAFT_259345 [Sphaerobolus stellatus SS14]
MPPKRQNAAPKGKAKVASSSPPAQPSPTTSSPPSSSSLNVPLPILFTLPNETIHKILAYFLGMNLTPSPDQWGYPVYDPAVPALGYVHQDILGALSQTCRSFCKFSFHCCGNISMRIRREGAEFGGSVFRDCWNEVVCSLQIQRIRYLRAMFGVFYFLLFELRILTLECIIQDHPCRASSLFNRDSPPHLRQMSLIPSQSPHPPHSAHPLPNDDPLKRRL